MQLRHTPSRLFARGWPLVAALVAVAGACYPSGVTNGTQLNTVSTVYDTAFDFKMSNPTYSMPGSTAANPGNCVVEDIADGGPYSFSNPANQTAICTTIQSELSSLGYTLVPTTNPTQPTYVVTVGGLNQSYTAWVSYPWYGYWGGYYPGYPWYGWGVYYPWYGYSYSYNVGTIVIAMVQPKADSSLPDGGVMNAVWAAALNGLNTPPNNTPQYISAGITQAFTQSPYLSAQ
jgi:Domain of unknown function (DUF4136)